MIPYRKAVVVMAEALIAHRWDSYPWHPGDGCSQEQWNEARDGDRGGIEDDMSIALQSLHDAGLVQVDWDDDDLQDCGCPGSGCTCERPNNGAETMHSERTHTGS